MPAFKPWRSRVDEICQTLGSATPAVQVATFVFASLGARASPHSALLGLDPDAASGHSADSPGSRREQACRALQERALDLNYRFGLGDDSSIANLEVLVLLAQQAAWNEVLPRKSRTLVRLALGQFVDIQEDQTLDEQVRADVVKRVGMRLVAVDAMVASFACQAPLVTKAVLAQSFRGINLPNLQSSQLSSLVGRFIDLARPGVVVHERLGGATVALFAWLLQCQRHVAALSGLRTDPTDAVRAMWSFLDQIHDCAQTLQDIVVHLPQPPVSCAELDGVSDLHMRFTTRVSHGV